MESVPNNAFDRCGPLRQYTLGTRAASFGVKALELSALGAATGGVFHGLTKGLIGLHRRNDADFEPSVPVPDLKTSMLGMGAYLGLSCNLRYQLIGGADDTSQRVDRDWTGPTREQPLWRPNPALRARVAHPRHGGAVLADRRREEKQNENGYEKSEEEEEQENLPNRNGVSWPWFYTLVLSTT